MKLVVTGAHGQLGRALARRGAALGHAVVALDRAALDVCDPQRVGQAVAVHSPQAVINAAAYTAVDRAEDDRATAAVVNTVAPGLMATACAERGVPFLHVSTDYVFDGTLRRPYREDDPVAPLGVYGQTKAEGERAVLAARGIVVRTSWLFSATGSNFVRTIARLADERPVLRVVADQHGCPSFADDVADALIAIAEQATSGVSIASIYHAAGDGPTTWHGFASAIVDALRSRRPVACTDVVPITTAEYPTPARRPAYSVLDTTKLRTLGITPRPWILGLERVMAELPT